MEISNIARRLVMILVVLFLFFVFSSVLSLSIYFSSNEHELSNVFSYQYSKINPKTNEITQGILESNEHIGEDDYRYFIDNEGVMNLISNFGMEEYECEGNCYCETDHSRRTSTVASRGLTFLIAAATSVAARNLAKSYFEEECLKNVLISEKAYSDCESDSIRSNVEECYAISTTDRETVKTSKQDIKNSRKRRQQSNGKKYQCRGNCVVNRGTNGKRSKNYYNEMNLFYGKVKRLEAIKFGARIGKFQDFRCPEWNVEKNVFAKSLAEAYLRFINRELQPYCFDNSICDLERKDGSFFKVRACIGYTESEGMDSWMRMMKKKGGKMEDGNIICPGNKSVVCNEIVGVL